MLFLSITSFTQSSITFTKEFFVSRQNYIVSNDKVFVEIVPYEEDVLRIVTFIETSTTNSVLQQLVKVGRYNISLNNGEILFDRLKDTIFIKGVELSEDILLRIYVPMGVELCFKGNQLVN